MKRKNWLIAATVALIAAGAAGDEPSLPRPDLEVTLKIDGGETVPLHYFILKVDFSGEVEGGGDLNPGLPPPSPRLSTTAHAQLAALLRKERFFSMPRGIGGCPPDLGFRSIQAWQGTKVHTVTFCLDKGEVPLRDAQAVLRVWYGVMSVVAKGKRVPPIGLDKELLARKR